MHKTSSGQDAKVEQEKKGTASISTYHTLASCPPLSPPKVAKLAAVARFSTPSLPSGELSEPWHRATGSRCQYAREARSCFPSLDTLAVCCISAMQSSLSSLFPIPTPTNQPTNHLQPPSSNTAAHDFMLVKPSSPTRWPGHRQCSHVSGIFSDNLPCCPRDRRLVLCLTPRNSQATCHNPNLLATPTAF